MTDEGRKQDADAPGAPGEEMLAGEAGTTRGGEDDRETEPDGSDSAAHEEDLPTHEEMESGGEASTAESGPDEAPDEAPDDTAVEPGPDDTAAEDLNEALAEARRAAQENLDRALRAQAELENVRRRVERDLQNAHKFALERFVSELLPVKDSLELGLSASAEKGASVESIAEGAALTLRMLEQAMEKFGITVVDPAGEPFNPEFHQAMTMQESETAESGTVLTVVQKGYLLNERLVRPAMVIVAK